MAGHISDHTGAAVSIDKLSKVDWLLAAALIIWLGKDCFLSPVLSEISVF